MVDKSASLSGIWRLLEVKLRSGPGGDSGPVLKERICEAAGLGFLSASSCTLLGALSLLVIDFVSCHWAISQF